MKTPERRERERRQKQARKTVWRRLPPQRRDDPALEVPCPVGHAPIGEPCRPSPRLVCAARCEVAAHLAPPDRAEASS